LPCPLGAAVRMLRPCHTPSIGMAVRGVNVVVRRSAKYLARSLWTCQTKSRRLSS
jgi:hypothetical protein